MYLLFEFFRFLCVDYMRVKYEVKSDLGKINYLGIAPTSGETYQISPIGGFGESW